MKKIAVKLALASLITLSASSHAQVDIDLTTASVGLAPQNTINISNISYGGAKYDATLQWNPIAGRFDVATAVQSSSNAKKCSLGKITSGSYTFSQNTADITMTLDSSAKTITIAYTPTATYNYATYSNADINILWDFNIIQQGAQLYMSTDSSKLSTNTALLTQQPDPLTGGTVIWNNVPGGSSRYAKITKIPSWFDFNLPIASVYDAVGSKTYTCM